jgi:hypothetical protein
MITDAPWYASILPLVNDLKIPFTHKEIILHANKYTLHTIGHSNQAISELFHGSNNVRILQSIRSEDLAR